MFSSKNDGTRTVRDLDNMSVAFPRLVERSGIFQPQLISNSEPDFATLKLRQAEPRHTLLVETKIPTHRDVGLSLGLLETLVVVSFDFDERTENILILVSVFVMHQDVLGFIVDPGLLEILECGVSVLAPKVLQTVDLLEGYLSGPQLLRFAGRLDKP